MYAIYHLLVTYGIVILQISLAGDTVMAKGMFVSPAMIRRAKGS